MDSNIEKVMNEATHATVVLYDEKKQSVSIVTKGGFNDIEVINLLEQAIYCLGQKIADKQNMIRNN